MHLLLPGGPAGPLSPPGERQSQDCPCPWCLGMHQSRVPFFSRRLYDQGQGRTRRGGHRDLRRFGSISSRQKADCPFLSRYCVVIPPRILLVYLAACSLHDCTIAHSTIHNTSEFHTGPFTFPKSKRFNGGPCPRDRIIECKFLLSSAEIELSQSILTQLYLLVTFEKSYIQESKGLRGLLSHHDARL